MSDILDRFGQLTLNSLRHDLGNIEGHYEVLCERKGWHRCACGWFGKKRKWCAHVEAAQRIGGWRYDIERPKRILA